MNEMTTAINAPLQRTALTPDDVAGQLSLIQQLMKRTMINGVDYGLIPGCGDKPTLLKPGAEKICLLLSLAPKIRCKRILLEKGHREYEATCSLSHRVTQQFIGEGVGVCSSMESKYRYRGAGRKCPSCGAEAIIKGKQEYGGGWVCFKKKGGCGSNFKDGDQSIESQASGKVENPDIADTFNTVKKISKKRAFVDAVLTSTGASVMFTQDIEDTHEPVEAAIVSRYITEYEQQEIGVLLAKSGRTWPQACKWLKLPATSSIVDMTEVDYHRLKLASLEAIAAKVPLPTPQPTTTAPVTPEPTPSPAERQPGDPDPEEIIDEPTRKHLGSLFTGSGWKWADLCAKIGAAPGAKPADLNFRQYEAAVAILSPAKAG